MRDFRRLPPVLRVANILRLLFLLVAIVGVVGAFLTTLSSSPQSGVYASRMVAIAVNLNLFALPCALAVQIYSTRFRQPDRRPFPLDSWQSQVRAILVPSALPFCALALAVVIPPTSLAFEAVFPITVIGAVVSLALALSMNNRLQAAD